jgi:hypothetical protein
MTQTWFTIAGLTLDFVGFCLLLREWWIAFLSDQAMLAHEEQLQQAQKFRAFTTQHAGNDQMRRHLETAGQMQDEMAIRRARDGKRASMAGRRRWFFAAGALIAAGFSLQLAGAWPAEWLPVL